jgi:hypothetical protein
MTTFQVTQRHQSDLPPVVIHAERRYFRLASRRLHVRGHEKVPVSSFGYAGRNCQARSGQDRTDGADGHLLSPCHGRLPHASTVIGVTTVMAGSCSAATARRIRPGSQPGGEDRPTNFLDGQPQEIRRE